MMTTPCLPLNVVHCVPSTMPLAQAVSCRGASVVQAANVSEGTEASFGHCFVPPPRFDSGIVRQAFVLLNPEFKTPLGRIAFNLLGFDADRIVQGLLRCDSLFIEKSLRTIMDREPSAKALCVDFLQHYAAQGNVACYGALVLIHHQAVADRDAELAAHCKEELYHPLYWTGVSQDVRDRQEKMLFFLSLDRQAFSGVDFSRLPDSFSDRDLIFSLMDEKNPNDSLRRLRERHPEWQAVYEGRRLSPDWDEISSLAREIRPKLKR